MDIAIKTVGKGMMLDKDVRISVEYVSTISDESGLDVYQCAADLMLIKPELKDSLPVAHYV